MGTKGRFGVRFAATLLAALLAACGGGSHAPATPVVAPAAVATAAPHGTGTLTVTITIPAASAASSSLRTPAYVSGSAQSIAIAVYPVTGGVISGVPATTANQDLTATSPGCSGTSPNVCSITVSAPLGTDAFGMTLYAGTGETGAVLSQLDPTAATERTIAEGANNVVLPLILSGVPASLAVSAPATTFHGGVTAAIAYTIVAKDAAGNTIIGNAPYETAITPTASDGSAFSFSPATVTSPTTAVTLNYNGNSTATSPTFAASAGAITATPITLAFSPAALGIACSGGCSGLTNGNTPYALTVSEAGLNGPVTASISGTACALSTTSVAVSGGTGTVSVYPNPAGGTCVVTAQDTYTQSVTSTTAYVAAGPPVLAQNCLNTSEPPDPNGGTLYSFAGCGAQTSVLYGSWYFTPLDSTYNPISFQIAAYANPANPYVTQFTVSSNRYITSASIGATYVIFNGQDGATDEPFTSLVP